MLDRDPEGVQLSSGLDIAVFIWVQISLSSSKGPQGEGNLTASPSV